MSLDEFAERFNQFLYRQTIRKLTPSDIELAREWCLNLIRREHPDLTPEEVERFYDNLLKVRAVAVDEWTQRMS